MTCSALDLLSLGWGDSSLNTVKWESSGNDIYIEICPPTYDLEKFTNGSDGQVQSSIGFLFTWVTGCDINFQFGEEENGEPSIFEIKLDELTDKQYQIRFDFCGMPDGYLQFRFCKVHVARNNLPPRWIEAVVRGNEGCA